MLKHIFVISSITAAFSTGVPTEGRVYGGQDAVLGQFPFMAAINDPDEECGGAIVAPSWVLTATQCIYWLGAEAQVFVGSHLNEVDGASYRIVERVAHTDFGDFTYKNDIALVKINGVFNYSDTVQAIELNGAVTANSTCTVLGWGETETEFYPENLKYADVTLMDSELCQSLAVDHLDGYYLGPEQVCTLGDAGRGACWGDSGGPLICDGKLTGVVSYTVGYDCGAGLPDVYSSVPVYAEWIQAHIQD